MKLTINPYDKDQCRAIVEEKFLPAIIKKFGTSSHLLYNKAVTNRYIEAQARSIVGRAEIAVSIVPCSVFYYLNYIIPNDNETIVDIGCGENLFKDVIPNVYGIDPVETFCDEKGTFDIEGEFAKKHYQQFSAAMAINSLHFTSLLNFSSILTLFSTIIKPNGRGYIAFNAPRMVTRTPKDELEELFGTTKPSPKQVEEYFDQEIKKIDLNFLVVDNIVRSAYYENIDGNVRLVFEV